MEPLRIKRGERVCMSRKRTPAEGKRGCFCGAVYCHSMVRAYGRAGCVRKPAGGENIASTERARAVPLPRQVLTDKKLPMPIYGAAEENAPKAKMN